MMDMLCDDVQREIISHLDSIQDIQLVSKHFNYIANTSKLYFEGHQNSTIFSLKALRQYMAQNNSDMTKFRMPWATEIDLATDFDDFNAIDPEILMKALKIIFHQEKKRHLILNSCSWALPGLPKFLSGYKFERILFSGHYTLNQTNNQGLVFSAKEVQVPASIYPFLNFIDVESLSLCLDYVNAEIGLEHDSVLKAFNSKESKNLKSLYIYGPFFTNTIFSEFVIDSKLLALKKLELNGQSCIWHDARIFQLCCPNLEHLKISASNLICNDLDYFDWTLWPRLKSLSLEDNFTLKEIKNWPPNLEHLNVLDTSIQLHNEKNFDTSAIKTLATACSTNAQWSEYFQLPTLESLTLKLEHFISGPQYKSRKNLGPEFWTQINKIPNLKVVSVEFMERLKYKHLFKELRNYLKPEIFLNAV